MYPFAQGGFRLVARATYTHGERRGEQAVVKWFKSGHVFESEFYDQDIKAMNKAVELVAQWNERGFIEQLVRVNVPQVWTYLDNASGLAGRKVLCEPFIENYSKFNSNTGWADSSTPWPQVMQALSHYSYHVSNRNYLLCDVQGGIYSNSVVLTDPAILSQTKEFGVTDLGPHGISSFFSQHRCNKFCKSHWLKPTDRMQYFQPQPGTSMASSSATGVATMAPPPPRFHSSAANARTGISRPSSGTTTQPRHVSPYMPPPPPMFAFSISLPIVYNPMMPAAPGSQQAWRPS